MALGKAGCALHSTLMLAALTTIDTNAQCNRGYVAMRIILAILSSILALAVAAPAMAETKTLLAYCSVPVQKVTTNVVSVTINVDTSSGNWYQLIKTIGEEIGYKASETLYKMGINTSDGVHCRFNDPSILEYVNNNQRIDQLRGGPAWMVSLGYRLVTVDGFGSPDRLASPKVAIPNTPSPPRKVAGVALPPPSPKGPTPNQLKYQRELADYKSRLAEIEKIKTNTAAKHSAGTAAAAAELARHQRELAQHQRELAVADAARKRYEADLAAHQQLVGNRETKQDRETKVEWREAVSVCVLNPTDGQAKFGNWRCDGPLQMNYAKLGNPGQAASAGAIAAISMTCGGSREAVRDLGMVGDAHLFGCSYGIHPQSKALDPVTKHGINYVPGRAIYRCPLYVSGCRTQ